MDIVLAFFQFSFFLLSCVIIGERVITGTLGLGSFGRIYHTTENDVLYLASKM